MIDLTYFTIRLIQAEVKIPPIVLAAARVAEQSQP
jgi:hypothetical protein